MKERYADRFIIYTAIGLLCLCTCVQGGFFPICIAFAGLIECILIFTLKAKFNIKCICALVFCLWYFFCAVRPGFILEYTANALLPLVSMLFFIILTSLDVKTRRKISVGFIKLSVIIAFISVICGVYTSLIHHKAERLTFPFQYSNACGIYFAVMIILSKQSGDKFIDKGRYIFYAALLMTQSIGAIILTAAAEFIYGTTRKKMLFMLICAALFAVLFHQRIYQSGGTFIERLLQIHDGAICILKNPVFGIGAMRWQKTGNLYKSGFYSSALIHSGIIQIGVDSGITGLLLFAAAIFSLLGKRIFSAKKELICIVIFLVHSCLDISMSFLGLDLLIMLTVSLSAPKTDYTVGKLYYMPLVIILTAVFAAAEYGIIAVKSADRYFAGHDLEKVIDKYENNAFIRTSVNGRLDYLKALYASGRFDEAADAIDKFSYRTDDMLILKAWCSTDDILIDTLRLEKYNERVYNEIKEGASDDIKHIADGIFEQAVNDMSFWGTKLYKRTER